MIAAIIKTEASGFANLIRRIAGDKRLGATHVSLCAALFVMWQREGFQNPFAVSRKCLMAYSSIASIATYHKCMRELNGYGYIRYQPSYHPKKGSLVYCLMDLSKPGGIHRRYRCISGYTVTRSIGEEEASLCFWYPKTPGCLRHRANLLFAPGSRKKGIKHFRMI